MRSTSSPILVNFGLGGSPQAYMHIAPGKKKKSWDSDLYKSHLGQKLSGELARRCSRNRGRRRRVRPYGGIASCKPADAGTDPDVTWGSGRGCPLVVHYWADLQSVHGMRCYVNIMEMRGRAQR